MFMELFLSVHDCYCLLIALIICGFFFVFCDHPTVKCPLTATIIEENSGGPPVAALVADSGRQPNFDMASNTDLIDDSQGLDICRVCRSEGLPDRPLFHPCICTGSIKWIHQECLIQWMRYSRKVR